MTNQRKITVDYSALEALADMRVAVENIRLYRSGYDNSAINVRLSNIEEAIGALCKSASEPDASITEVDADIAYWKKKYDDLDVLYDQLESEKLSLEQQLHDRT